MRLIVDGDACPVKELVLRAAHRLRLELLLVSNKPMAFGQEPGVTAVIVPEGPNEADRWIAQEATPADLVITADLPLAAALVEKEVTVVGHRGEVFDQANIADLMAGWALHRALREEGQQVGGPKAFGPKDRAAFASALDKALTRLQRKR